MTTANLKYRAVMTFYLPDAAVDEKAYESLGIGLVQHMCKTEDEIIAVGGDADFLLPIGRQPITRRVIENLTRCRLIDVMGIGYDGVDVDVATERGICVVNNPYASVDEVSDHAMALALACSRRLFPLIDLVRRKEWTATATREMRKVWLSTLRLRGQTLGLVGFGNVPQALVPKAKGFGLRVLTYDPYVDSDVSRRLGVEQVDLQTLLAQSDFVSLHAKLTSQNRGMMGSEQFNQMKPTAFIINTARGGLIDEAALVAALDFGHIAGAALDVTDPEPPATDNPLIGRENVLITPHSAHASQETWHQQWNAPANEIARLLAGEWPQGLVNYQVKEIYSAKWGFEATHP